MKHITPTPTQICQMCHWSSECPTCCKTCAAVCSGQQNYGLTINAKSQAPRWTTWQNLTGLGRKKGRARGGNGG